MVADDDANAMRLQSYSPVCARSPRPGYETAHRIHRYRTSQRAAHMACRRQAELRLAADSRPAKMRRWWPRSGSGRQRNARSTGGCPARVGKHDYASEDLIDSAGMEAITLIKRAG